MGMGLQVEEELIKRKTFKIQRAPQVWGRMMNSIDSLLSLGGPGKNSKRSLACDSRISLAPCGLSYLWVDFHADTWTHEPRSEPSTPVCPGDKPPHMTLERALGSIGKNLCRRKWQLNPIFFFLESPMDSGAWWATAQEVPKISDTT